MTEGSTATILRPVGAVGVNLVRVSEAALLGERVARGEVDTPALSSEVERLNQLAPPYPRLVLIAAAAGNAAAFSQLQGGDWGGPDPAGNARWCVVYLVPGLPLINGFADVVSYKYLYIEMERIAYAAVMEMQTILINSFWASLSAGGLGILFTTPPRYLAAAYFCGFAGRFTRDSFMIWNMSQNWSTVVAVSQAFTTSLAIAIGLVVGMAVMRWIKGEQVWE